MCLKKAKDVEGTFTHLTPIKNLSSIKEQGLVTPKDRGGGINKPIGVWLSLNGGWEHFCEVDYHGHAIDYDYYALINCSIKPDINLVVIDSLDDFYEALNSVGIEKQRYYHHDTVQLFWSKLKLISDGLLLTHKGQFETRWETFLYGWDCASVCIWKEDSIIINDIHYNRWDIIFNTVFN